MNIKSSANAIVEKPSWKDGVAKDTNGISRKGYIAVAITLGVFIAWAVLFPLSSAVVAVGAVIAAGQNKLLQHPTGGVVRQIAVNDGAVLKKGDLVAIIEPAPAKAELAALIAQRDLLLAKKSRLLSSKSNAKEYETLRPTTISMLDLRGAASFLPTQSIPTQNSGLIYVEQKAEFDAGKKRFESELSALKNQQITLNGEFEAVSRQIKRNKSRLALLNKQHKKIAPLAKAGYVAKSRIWEIEANQLDISSRIAALEGNFDGLASRMEEVSDKMATLVASRDQENSRELTQILTDLASIEERVGVARKMVAYSEIRAPVAGTLTNLTVHTIGGVVEAGAQIAQIVPSSQPLLIEARITPADVNSISIDQSADIVISAFNPRLQDPIEGKVIYVSADAQLDQNTGENFFITRIKLAPKAHIATLLKTGMSAQVFLQTESRSFASYVMRPMTDSFRKAFREQ